MLSAILPSVRTRVAAQVKEARGGSAAASCGAGSGVGAAAAATMAETYEAASSEVPPAFAATTPTPSRRPRSPATIVYADAVAPAIGSHAVFAASQRYHW